MDKFIMLLVIVSAFVAGLTYLIHRFTTKRKLIKYIPGVISTVLAGYNFYVVRQPHMGFEGIALALLMVVLLWIAIINIITGVVIDYVYPMVDKRK